MTPASKSGSHQVAEFLLVVAAAIGIAFGIQAFLVKPYRIPSESMVPTLEVGQRVLVNRIGNHFGDPSIGDIVVFHPPQGADGNDCGNPQRPETAACDRPTDDDNGNVNYIKRVVGRPGDRISILADGRVMRNGRLADEPFIRRCGPESECSFPTTITIPAGHYFMMGDNRGESDDSRFWGPVKRDWIVGGAFATYWPPRRINLF